MMQESERQRRDDALIPPSLGQESRQSFECSVFEAGFGKTQHEDDEVTERFPLQEDGSSLN